MKREGIVNLLNTYYENNAKKLHFVVDQIFNRHYGGTNGKDMEEFYGVATDVLIEIWEKENYDSSKGDFNGYVYNALRMALIDEFKKRDCDKRVAKVFLLDENGNKILDEKTNKPKKIPISDVYLDTQILIWILRYLKECLIILIISMNILIAYQNYKKKLRC